LTASCAKPHFASVGSKQEARLPQR